MRLYTEGEKQGVGVSVRECGGEQGSICVCVHVCSFYLSQILYDFFFLVFHMCILPRVIGGLGML